MPHTLLYRQIFEESRADLQHLLPESLVPLYEFFDILLVLSRSIALAGLDSDGLGGRLNHRSLEWPQYARSRRSATKRAVTEGIKRVARLVLSETVFLRITRLTLPRTTESYPPGFSDSHQVACWCNCEQGKLPLNEGSEGHWKEGLKLKLGVGAEEQDGLNRKWLWALILPPMNALPRVAASRSRYGTPPTSAGSMKSAALAQYFILTHGKVLGMC